VMPEAAGSAAGAAMAALTNEAPGEVYFSLL